MPGLIGTVKPYEMTEKIKSILNIKGDFSLFAIPTEILRKNNADSISIYENKNSLDGILEESHQTSTSHLSRSNTNVK